MQLCGITVASSAGERICVKKASGVSDSTALRCLSISADKSHETFQYDLSEALWNCDFRMLAVILP